jgi:hypothetical protein
VERVLETAQCEHRQPADECQACEVLDQLSRLDADWDSPPLTYWQELEEELRPLLKGVV